MTDEIDPGDRADDAEALDAVDLEILRNQLESVAEEMGQVLIRGAYSPNITERRDCSTALFDATGRMIAQAEHIPVHLGAMPEAVAAVRDCDPQPGDVFALNDPFTGGTHLPDVTLVAPISHEGDILGYTVSRAHHADVGGMSPGSMPAGARDIQQEGLRLPPVRRAANDRGARRLLELYEEHGDRLLAAFDAVIDYSRSRLESELREIPDGEYRATDALEGDGVTDAAIPIEVAVRVDGTSVEVDFTGTAGQVAGNVNAPLPVAKSAVYFVIRCVTDPDIPPNHGCYEPVTVYAPAGSLLDPKPPAAVVGGNVETSQRVTDVVFAALADAAPERVPAQGQGTMNNLIVGSSAFVYYETIGGGAGANPDSDGLSGVQVGMTNTRNTPVEALEAAYPLRVEEYALRTGSGGDGQFRGGDGLVRALRMETDATVSLLTERRSRAPSGVAGGDDGASGRNAIDGEEVPAKMTREIDAGTTVRVETPGGGGYGE
ncbi:MAG: 5-oxoprolinase [Halobacteriales archaeon SW_8_66_22]|nr:MAG: 5-oxoprolinase [Halobacteriales archaeon SW_8_66_22]